MSLLELNQTTCADFSNAVGKAVNSSLTLSEAVTFQRCKQWGRQGDELRPRAPTCRPGSRQAGLTHWHRIQALAMSLPVLLKTRPTRENMEGV